LDQTNFNKNNYQRIDPKSPWYFYIIRNTLNIQKYLKWKRIDEIFPVNVTGIFTARDKITIHWNKQETWNTVLNFSRLEPELARIAYNAGKDSEDWKVVLAQNDIKNSGPSKNKIHPILYRPFDLRYTYYTGKSKGFISRPRPEVMPHMLEENIGLISVRQVAEGIFNHCYITEDIIECRITLSNRGYGYLYPLYLYPLETKKDNPGRGFSTMMLFEPIEKYGRKPNIAPIIFEKLEFAYKKKPSPEDILYYIYGIFYSNIYRETYTEFLKIDFPRVPFTADYQLFKAIGELGNALADLHLLKSSALDPPVAKYQGSGTNDRIEKIIFNKDEQRIYINIDKYFEGVKSEVWNYHIGGYQVLNKYLKDRKGRIMDDAPRYCRIVTALSKTIKNQEKIDKVYPEIEKNLINF